MLTKDEFYYLSCKLKIICINVPGSLLHAGVERRTALTQMWSSVMSTEEGAILHLEFLDNTCTPAEVLSDDRLADIAKRQDTFYPFNLRHEVVASLLVTKQLREDHQTFIPFSSTGQMMYGQAKKYILSKDLVGEEKQLQQQWLSKMEEVLDSLIQKNWTWLVKILSHLQFKNHRDPVAVDTAIKELDILSIVYPKSGFVFEDYKCYDHAKQYLVLEGLLDAVRTKLTRTACTESHIRAYHHLARRDDCYGLVLEDDLFIDPSFPQQLCDVIQHLEEKQLKWDMVQLGYSIHKARPNVSFDHLLSKAPQGAYGSTAILVRDPRAVCDLLRESYYISAKAFPNDVVLALAAANHIITGFVVAKRKIGPVKDSHLSEIAGSQMDYTECCWDAENQ